jgi:glycerol-3-phosphate dehydrogenase (NAD(P)+)
MRNLAIIGGGSWGTALAIALAPRFPGKPYPGITAPASSTAPIRLWVYESDLAARMQATRENDVFLPGFRLPENVRITRDLAEAVTGADIVLSVMPSRHVRRLYTEMLPSLDPNTMPVSATKGLENNSLLRMSQVIHEVVSSKLRAPVAVLSGPTFAREIAGGEPAAVVVASADLTVAKRVQAAFSGPSFRLYTNPDPTGVELGAALKNVVAIGAGVCQGLGLGNNTLAALITRGLAEITRLAVAAGGQQATLSGLAGLGDLVLTCTGDLSRNRKVGMELARGRTLAEITGSMRMIAEGVETCQAAVALAQRFQVDLPITQQMYAVLYEGKSPRESLRDLMERSLKSE